MLAIGSSIHEREWHRLLGLPLPTFTTTAATPPNEVGTTRVS